MRATRVPLPIHGRVPAEGAQVAVTGRDQKTLDQAVAELGPHARGYRADITVPEDRKRLFAALAKDFGKLDIVFANAGISGRTPTGSTDETIFENVIHTNLNGAFFTVNSAAPLLNDNEKSGCGQTDATVAAGDQSLLACELHIACFFVGPGITYDDRHTYGMMPIIDGGCKKICAIPRKRPPQNMNGL